MNEKTKGPGTHREGEMMNWRPIQFTVAGFRIGIGFLRIRIQHFEINTDPYAGPQIRILGYIFDHHIKMFKLLNCSSFVQGF